MTQEFRVGENGLDFPAYLSRQFSAQLLTVCRQATVTGEGSHGGGMQQRVFTWFTCVNEVFTDGVTNNAPGIAFAGIRRTC